MLSKTIESDARRHRVFVANRSLHIGYRRRRCLPTYKLTDFDYDGGGGEDCQLALPIAGAAFEDSRIGRRGAWSELNPIRFGPLPVPETASKPVLGRANAILTILGPNFGRYPNDLWRQPVTNRSRLPSKDLRGAIGPPRAARVDQL